VEGASRPKSGKTGTGIRTRRASVGAAGQITKVIGSKLLMLGDRKKPVLSEVEKGWMRRN
jgi:hypothetical protein